MAVEKKTDIKSSPYPGASVVPSHCLATYDRRLLPKETDASVMAEIRHALAGLKFQDPRARVSASLAVGKETCYTDKVIEAQRFFPGWRFEDDEWFVSQALEGLRRCGFEALLSHYDFCTNGSHYAGEAGIPTLGFGPSFESLAHTIDESIEIDQLLAAYKGYLALMRTFLK
jgi:acetylornithine deacetylase/succinyl-diaminopimelate desuccinylase-like protein